METLIFRLIKKLPCRNRWNFWIFHVRKNNPDRESNPGLQNYKFDVLTTTLLRIVKNFLWMNAFYQSVPVKVNYLDWVLSKVLWSQYPDVKITKFLHGGFLINQKINATIVFYSENTSFYSRISHFDFLWSP